MPPKRKTKRKPPKRSKSQSQSQRQSVTINLNKTTPAKKKRSGRGGLPPPSYQQNLFPPTILPQQAPNIAVLENQISRLTSMIQEPIGIKQPTTPLGLETGAKNAEAQRLAGEQAEARRPGPTAENFQAPASLSRQDVGEFGIDPFGFPEPVSKGRTPVGAELQRQKDTMETIREMRTNLREPVLQTPAQITEDINTRASLQVLRPPDPEFNQRLVNPADPPKRGDAGQGEGGGNIPFAETRPLVGRPSKDTQQATPIGTPSAKPTKPPKAQKKQQLSKVAKELKEAGEQPGQKKLDPSTFPPKLKK